MKWILIETGLPEIGESVFVETEYISHGRPASDSFYGYMDEYGDLKIHPNDEDYGWQFNDCVKRWARLDLTDESTSIWNPPITSKM